MYQYQIVIHCQAKYIQFDDYLMIRNVQTISLHNRYIADTHSFLITLIKTR